MGLFDKLFKKEKPQAQKQDNKANKDEEQADKQAKHKFRMYVTEKTLLEIIDDFKKNKKTDKFYLNKNQWLYKFENGKQIRLIKIDNISKFEIIVDTYWWRITSSRLHNLIDEIFNIKDSIKTYQEEPPKTYQQPKQEPKQEPVINHRLKDKYNLCVRQIKIREEELKETYLTTSQRQTLHAELEVYKNVARNLKYKILNNL